MASLRTAGFLPPERRQLQGKSGEVVGAPGSEEGGWRLQGGRQFQRGVGQGLDTMQGESQESGRSWTRCRGWRRRPAGAGHGEGGGDAGATGRRWRRSMAAAGHGAGGSSRVPVQMDMVQGVAQETCRSWTRCGGCRCRSHGQEVAQEYGSSGTWCKGLRKSPSAAGQGAGGGAGDLQELDTVRGVAIQEPRAGGDAGVRKQLDTMQGVAQ